MYFPHVSYKISDVDATLADLINAHHVSVVRNQFLVSEALDYLRLNEPPLRSVMLLLLLRDCILLRFDAAEFMRI